MKILLFITSLCLAACSADDAPPPPKAKEGRAETQSIRNTQAIGYDGKAIANKVDAALTANDEQIKKAQRESEEGKQPE